MTKALYMDDCYQKEFSARVVSVKDGKFVVLDQTAFYPKSGGVDCDTGILTLASTTSDDTAYNVVFVGKFGGEISHEVDRPGLQEGDTVHGKIDWDRRHLLMRYHTGAHVLSGILSRDAVAKITGNDLSVDKGRIDFDCEEYDRDKLILYVEKANALIAQDLPIKIYTISREEAERDPLIFKLAKALPAAMTEFRVVDIVGFDRQADGGAHVKSLKEVGKLEFVRAENKGKSNRRMYFKIVP
jgi:misacylated tRNA(Ala) deacylase